MLWIPLTEPHRLPAACGLYLIRHRESGLEYVGKSVNIRSRAYDHRRARTGVTYLYRAIRKHGVEAFDICVLALGTEAEMTQLEIDTIAARGTFNPAGYNQTRGGDGISGYRATPEHRAAISARQLGRAITEETKAKMRESRLINNPFRGRRHSPETLAKMSAALTGRPSVKSEEGMESFRAAMAKRRGKPGHKHTDEMRQHLSDVKKGVPRPDGFGDRYRGEKNPMFGKRSAFAKQVIAWVPNSLTPMTFDTAELAAIWAGCSAASMSAYCSGKQRAKSGILFAFA
jgi:group I intron endonuclease